MSRHQRLSAPSYDSDGSDCDTSATLGGDIEPIEIDTDSKAEELGRDIVWLDEDKELPSGALEKAA